MSLKLVIMFVVVTIGLLLGMTILLAAGSGPKVGNVSANSPKASVVATVFDLGTMKVADVKQAEFTIKNDGRESLKIINMNSSCGCTKGQFIYKGKASPEFGMHAQSGYLGAVAAGEEAQVRVIYRPAEMPVYGAVEREVSVETNDPTQPKLTFKVTARVE